MVLTRRTIFYCEPCGMPTEYCVFSPDYETHCKPWVKANNPEEYKRLQALRKIDGANEDVEGESPGAAEDQKPDAPWTMEERLVHFYEKYQPDKVDGVPKILDKYAGKEDKLFMALTKKYGPEPEDPYYADSDEDEDGSDLEEGVAGMTISDKKKRRGAAAKKVNKVDTRIIIQKISRNKRKAVTIIVGMETVPGIKLKEVSKACSKRFAGSSSVKDVHGGKKEIIIQGDHMDDVAAMIIDKFKVPADSVYLDIDGKFVPFK